MYSTQLTLYYLNVYILTFLFRPKMSEAAILPGESLFPFGRCSGFFSTLDSFETGKTHTTSQESTDPSCPLLYRRDMLHARKTVEVLPLPESHRCI